MHDDEGDEQIKAIRLGFLSRALSKDALTDSEVELLLRTCR